MLTKRPFLSECIQASGIEFLSTVASAHHPQKGTDSHPARKWVYKPHLGLRSVVDLAFLCRKNRQIHNGRGVDKPVRGRDVNRLLLSGRGGAFLLTVGTLVLTVKLLCLEQLRGFCLQLSFFAYNPLRPLLDTLSHCKQKSSNCK